MNLANLALGFTLALLAHFALGVAQAQDDPQQFPHACTNLDCVCELQEPVASGTMNPPGAVQIIAIASLDAGFTNKSGCCYAPSSNCLQNITCKYKLVVTASTVANPPPPAGNGQKPKIDWALSHPGGRVTKTDSDNFGYTEGAYPNGKSLECGQDDNFTLTADGVQRETYSVACGGC
jgi:hypothetical protein